MSTEEFNDLIDTAKQEFDEALTADTEDERKRAVGQAVDALSRAFRAVPCTTTTQQSESLLEPTGEQEKAIRNKITKTFINRLGLNSERALVDHIEWCGRNPCVANSPEFLYAFATNSIQAIRALEQELDQSKQKEYLE